MLSLALPSHLDAQLFNAVTSGTNAQEVIRLLDAGARADVPFSLNYKFTRGQTTTITLTAIEAVFVGWNLVDLSKVITHMGPLPDVAFPNVSSAFHQVGLVHQDDLYHSQDYSSTNKLLLSLENIRLHNESFWRTPFLALSMWECIAYKDLEKEHHSHLPTIANALRNLPKISDPLSLERVAKIPKSSNIKCGTLLCAKMGVDSENTFEEYQYLINQTIDHPLEPLVSSCLLQWEIDEQTVTTPAIQTQRKM